MPAQVQALSADADASETSLRCITTTGTALDNGSRLDPAFNPWLPVCSTTIAFPLEIFYQICDELVLHPERNSSSILRCDILDEHDVDAVATSPSLLFESYVCTKIVRRRILPRRPFDGILDQDCFFYASASASTASLTDGLVVLLPRLQERKEAAVPFYHPKVAGLAFRYLSSSSHPPAPSDTAALPISTLQIDILPLEAGPSFVPPPPKTPYYPETSRTYRTALHLATMIAKYGKGFTAVEHYVKRVHHDAVIPREEFQDLYLQLKEKYTWILDEWKESTDPVKHVFEDVAIATYLICLWKTMYPETQGKPPGGFVDVGCGNGLLVFLLWKEGYEGYGVDLRARKSWQLWGSKCPLETSSLSPAELCLQDEAPFNAGSFLIGNHADELTPWIPLLAAKTPNSGFVNIPCCFHTFIGRFTASSYTFPPDLLETSDAIKRDMAKFESLSSERGGRYYCYLVYIAEIVARAGWRIERDALRIPSTKCWALVGRTRLYGASSSDGRNQQEVNERQTLVHQWVTGVAEESRLTWQPRKPEGKDH